MLKLVDKANKRVGFSAKIGVGDMIAPITEANFVFQEGRTNVEHKEGQVILYDLWATWCPPC